MVTNVQWQTARKIITEATCQQGANKIESVMMALEQFLGLRRLVVYQWDANQIASGSIARFSIERDSQQRLRVSSIDHPEVRQIQKDMKRHQAADLIDEMVNESSVGAYQISARPPHLTAMFREQLSGTWSASVILLTHSSDNPTAQSHYELLQCTLPAMAAILRNYIETNRKTPKNPLSTRFTPKEKQVLSLLVSGDSSHQMALSLGIARRTLQFHLKNIYRKTGAKNRQEAIVRILELEEVSVNRRSLEHAPEFQGKDTKQKGVPIQDTPNAGAHHSGWGRE